MRQAKAMEPKPVAVGVPGGPVEAAQSAGGHDSAGLEEPQTATSGTPEVPLVAAREAPQEDGDDIDGHKKRPQKRAARTRGRPQGATSGSKADPPVAAGTATRGRSRRPPGKAGAPEGERHRGHPPFRMKGIEWRFIGRYWYALSRHWVPDPKTGKKKRKRKYLGRLDK